MGLKSLIICLLSDFFRKMQRRFFFLLYDILGRLLGFNLLIDLFNAGK